MGMDRISGIFVCVDTHGIDIEINENTNSDLFYRPICQYTGVQCPIWISNRNNAIKPQTFDAGTICDTCNTLNKSPASLLTPEQKTFLDSLNIKYTLYYMYLTWWS